MVMRSRKAFVHVFQSKVVSSVNLIVGTLRFGLMAIAVLGLIAGCASRKTDSKLQAYLELATSFFSDHQYPECIGATERASELEPANLAAKNLRGLCLLGIDKFSEAEKLLTEVCSSVPSADCFNNLAAVHEKSKNPKKCVEMTHKALAVNSYTQPENALSNQALCQIQLRDLASAQNSIDEAKKKAPQNCTIRLLSAKIMILRGALDDAVRESENATSLCPALPKSHFWEAYTLYKNGRKTDAYKKYSFIVEQFRKGEFVEQSKINLEMLENHIPIPEPKQ